jgi:hypothetical protein
MQKNYQKGLAPIFILAIACGFLIIALFFIKNYFISKKFQSPQGTEDAFSNFRDCKESFDCFIESSKNCTPAKMRYKTPTVEIFGAKITAQSFFAIKGKENNKCLLYLKTEKADIEFPQDAPKELVDQYKAIYKALEGRDGICKFETEELKKLLEKWKEGKFSSSDFDNADCQGKYFEAPEEEYRGKRIPANTKDTVEVGECPGETIPRKDDNTACFENQKDIGTIEGLKIDNKPVQCCVEK